VGVQEYPALSGPGAKLGDHLNPGHWPGLRYFAPLGLNLRPPGLNLRGKGCQGGKGGRYLCSHLGERGKRVVQRGGAGSRVRCVATYSAVLQMVNVNRFNNPQGQKPPRNPARRGITLHCNTVISCFRSEIFADCAERSSATGKRRASLWAIRRESHTVRH